jgi:hypothetical protein
MMMPTLRIAVTVAVAAVSAAFGLERGLHLYKIRFKPMEHVLNHMVGPNAKNLVSNFGWQMPVPQMPGKKHQLNGIFMPDFYNKLRSGLNL